MPMAPRQCSAAAPVHEKKLPMKALGFLIVVVACGFCFLRHAAER